MVGKLEAKKAWVKMNGSMPDIETLIAKINELKKSDQWNKDKGQYIPNPATFLNQGRWDDEVRCDSLFKRERWEDIENV
jgi:hypothetical protein